MFILSQSLQFRIALFLYATVLLLLPVSLNLLDRSTFALMVVVLFFQLLPHASGYTDMEVEGWVMWLDALLSYIMLVTYASSLFLVWYSEGAWWGYLLSGVLVLFGIYSTLCWYGFKALFADELLRYEA